MTVRYSINWMGPINIDWINEYGKHWSAGRIDMYGESLGMFGDEVTVPIMSQWDWEALSAWLEAYVTDEPDYDVLETFEAALGRRPNYWNKLAARDV